MKRAAKVLIRNGQGKILTLYNSQTHPTMAFLVDLPGGIVESGESIECGLEREILEETGLRLPIKESDLCHSWTCSLGQDQYLYNIICDGIADVAISWEHHKYAWLEPSEFLENDVISDFMQQAQAWLAQQDSTASLSPLVSCDSFCV